MVDLRVALGVPFGSNADDNRTEVFKYTQNIMKDIYPWIRMDHTAAWTDGKFNRSQARNTLVFYLNHCDVVVLCDADTYPEKAPLAEAVNAAYAEGGFHFPADVVQPMKRFGKKGFTYGPSAGGCWVFRPEEWWECGGMDERLGGWGTDDRSFLECIRVFSSKTFHPGTLTTMWHSRDDCRPDQIQSEILRNEYLDKSRSEIEQNLIARGFYGWEPSWL